MIGRNTTANVPPEQFGSRGAAAARELFIIGFIIRAKNAHVPSVTADILKLEVFLKLILFLSWWSYANSYRLFLSYV